MRLPGYWILGLFISIPLATLPLAADAECTVYNSADVAMKVDQPGHKADSLHKPLREISYL